jgi:hypothetical protein
MLEEQTLAIPLDIPMRSRESFGYHSSLPLIE